MFQLLNRRQVAPRAEGVDVGSYGVDDVVDAVLYDDICRSGHIHLDGKTRGTFQSVCLIGDAVILSQDASAADGAAYDGDIGTESLLCHVVGPRLCRDGVAIAHNGMVLWCCQHIDGVQEIKPVGVARQGEGQFIGLGIVAIGIIAFGERTCDERSAVHLCESSQIDAHLYGVTTADGIANGITLCLLARHEHNRGLAAEGHRGMTHKDLVECDGLCAGEVRETKAQHATAETHPDGVAQGDVFGIDSLAAVGDGGGIAPTSNPFVIVCHITSVLAPTS